MYNKILTRDNLRRRGWLGEVYCTMCEEQKSVSHLFFTCHIAKQIWFWMCISRNYFSYWNSIKDVIEFVLSLSPLMRKSFLIVLSAVCWALLKHRNQLIFKSSTHTSTRNLIYLILSLINYWAGGFNLALVRAMKQWLPDYLDMIPLNADIDIIFKFSGDGPRQSY
jgi:zinc-binding in reverse transcriptase